MNIKPYLFIAPALLAAVLNVDAQNPKSNTIKAGHEKEPKHEIKAANKPKDLEAELKQLESSPDRMNLFEALYWKFILSTPVQVPPSPTVPFNPNPPIPNANIVFPRRKEEDVEGGGPPEGKPSKKKKRTNPFAEPPILKDQRLGIHPATAQNKANLYPKNRFNVGAKRPSLNKKG